MTYPVPDGRSDITLEIKKSRFIAWAARVESRESAMALLGEAKQRYPDARHHCWAYVLGNPYSPQSAAMSDDGEPGGTAGKPILNVLQHKQIGDIMVIVIRYFGGIKLGAGGLVRAYSAAAQQAIDALPLHTAIARTHVIWRGDFRHEQFLRHWSEQHDAIIDNVEYNHTVTLTASIPDTHLTAMQTMVASLGIEVELQDE